MTTSTHQNNLEFAVKSRHVRRSYEFTQARDIYSERRLPFPMEKPSSLCQSPSAKVLTESNIVNKMSDNELQSLFGYSKQEAICVSAGLSTLSLSNIKRHKSHKSYSRHSYSAKFSDNQNSFMSPKVSSHDLNKEIERYTKRKVQRFGESTRRSSHRVNPYLLDRPTAPLARVLMSSTRDRSLPQSFNRDSISFIHPVGEEASVCDTKCSFTPIYDDDKENLDPSNPAPSHSSRLLSNISHNHCPSPPRIAAKRPNNLINPSPIPAKLVSSDCSWRPVAKVHPYSLPPRISPEGAELNQYDEHKEAFRSIIDSEDLQDLPCKFPESAFDQCLPKCHIAPVPVVSHGEKSAFRRPILAKTFSPIVTIIPPMTTAE